MADKGEWTIVGESYSNFPFSVSVEGGAQRLRVPQGDLGSTSFWHYHVQLMETVWILVETRRMDSLWDEPMCQVQPTHKVG